MKRCLSLLLCLLTLLSSLAALPAFAAVTDTAESGAADWSALYRDFFEQKRFLTVSAPGYDEYAVSNIKFSLFDLDADGVPELISSTGFNASSTYLGNDVFSIIHARVKFVDIIGFKNATLFYHPYSKYPGLFAQGKTGNTGTDDAELYETKYYLLKDKQLETKNVLKVKYNRKTKVYTPVIPARDAVYYAYIDATNATSTLRTAKYPLKAFSVAEIEEMGWDSFVKSFFYVKTPDKITFKNAKVRGKNGVKLSWNAIPGAVRYRIYMKTKDGYKSLGSTEDMSFFHSTSQSSKTYVYTLRCLDKDRDYNSYYYKDDRFKFTHYNSFDAVKLKKLTNTANGPRLVFEQTTGASGYRVFRKSGSSSWKKLGDVVASRDFILDKTAEKGKTYTYTVRCLSSDKKQFESGYDKTGLTITCKK